MNKATLSTKKCPHVSAPSEWVGTENPLGTHGVRAQIRGSRAPRSSCGFWWVGLVEPKFWEDDPGFFSSQQFFWEMVLNVLRHVICPWRWISPMIHHFLEIMDSQFLTFVLRHFHPFALSHLQGKNVAVSRYSDWFLPGFSGDDVGDDVYAVNETCRD